MTREEYIELIERRIVKFNGIPANKYSHQLAEDIAMHIWNPEEVARASSDFAKTNEVSLQEAVAALDQFVKAADLHGQA